MSASEGQTGTKTTARSMSAQALKQIVQGTTGSSPTSGLAPSAYLNGYAKAETEAAIATTDTISTAIGKLEKALDGKQASGSYEVSTNKVTATTGYDTTSTASYPSMATTQAMITSSINTNNTTLAGQINGKVSTAQGSGKANLAVITNSSGNITTGTIATGMITDGAVTSGKIADGTIANADISNTAAIESKKIADLAKVTSATAGNKDGVFVLTAKVTNGVAEYYWEDIGR